MTPSEHNIESLRTRISLGETNATAVVKAAVDAAENLNDTLNAFLQIDRQGALARAAEIDGAADGSSLLGSLTLGIQGNHPRARLPASCGACLLRTTCPP